MITELSGEEDTLRVLLVWIENVRNNFGEDSKFCLVVLGTFF